MTANPFAALLDGVPRYTYLSDYGHLEQFMEEADILAALAAAVPADLAEAGKVLAHLYGPHEWGYRDIVVGGFVPDDKPYRAADLITALIARIAAMEAQIKGLEAERDDAVVKRAAWELAAKNHAEWQNQREAELAAERAKAAKLVEALAKAANRLDWAAGIIATEKGRDQASAWADGARAAITEAGHE